MGPCVRRDDANEIKMNPRHTHLRILAARYARVVAGILDALWRAWGMPGARCTRSRAWSVVNTRVSHHGYTGSPGIPARNGFNGFLRALPGDRALLSPSLANFESANLTPASRRQDHTTSPSASWRPRQKRRLRPSHPVPTSVTIAKRPSDRDGIRSILVLIWERDQQCRLRQIGTTGKSSAALPLLLRTRPSLSLTAPENGTHNVECLADAWFGAHSGLKSEAWSLLPTRGCAV